MSFHLLPNGLEEAQFKRDPEGWLFTTVSPWIFAPHRTYLISDAQQPAIAERIRRGLKRNARTNERHKWDWSANPVWQAVRAMG